MFQLFFLGYAQSHCSNIHPKMETLLSMTDQHSPMKIRVNNAVKNMPQFSRAWQCQDNINMVPGNDTNLDYDDLDSEERCVLW